MKAPYLLLLVPCAILAACNRAETPGERSDTMQTPMSSPDTRDDTSTAIGIDQNGNATSPSSTVNPNTGMTGTGTGTPGTGTSGAGTSSSGTDATNGDGTSTSGAGGTNTTRPDGGSADDNRRNQ
jgi:hypothetical protein